MPKEWHKPKNPSPKLKASGEPAPVNSDTAWTTSASPGKKRGPVVQPLTAAQEKAKDEAAKVAVKVLKEEADNWQGQVSKRHRPLIFGVIGASVFFMLIFAMMLPQRYDWAQFRSAGGMFYDDPNAERCIAAFDKAVKAARFKYTEDSPQFIATEQALGQCYEAHKRYLSAADCYMNTVKIIEREVPVDNSSLKYALSLAADAYQHNSNLTEARQAREKLRMVERNDKSGWIAWGSLFLIFFLQALVMAFRLAADGPDEKEVVKNTFWIYLVSLVPPLAFVLGWGFYLMGGHPYFSMLGAAFLSFGLFPLFFLGVVAGTQGFRDSHYLIETNKNKKAE